jgi:hypothetical protein
LKTPRIAIEIYVPLNERSEKRRILNEGSLCSLSFIQLLARKKIASRKIFSLARLRRKKFHLSLFFGVNVTKRHAEVNEFDVIFKKLSTHHKHSYSLLRAREHVKISFNRK